MIHRLPRSSRTPGLTFPPARTDTTPSIRVTTVSATSAGWEKKAANPPDSNKEHAFTPSGVSHSKPDFLIRFTRLMRTDLDRQLAVQPPEKIEQLIRGEAAEMPVKQVRNLGLFDPKQLGNLPLPE